MRWSRAERLADAHLVEGHTIGIRARQGSVSMDPASADVGRMEPHRSGVYLD